MTPLIPWSGVILAVTFVAAVPQNDIPTLFLAMAAFVFVGPARQDREDGHHPFASIRD